MYRRSRFLIGFLAAALTFGSLMATFGPEHFHRSMYFHHRYGNCCMYNDEHMNPYDEPERFERHYRYERFQQNEPAEAPLKDSKTDSVKNK